jgi:hypothetical protein
VTSFLWAVAFALFILVGGIATGFSSADAFMAAVVAAPAIFLFVRICGEDDPDRL